MRKGTKLSHAEFITMVLKEIIRKRVFLEKIKEEGNK